MIEFLLVAFLAYANATPIDQCSAGPWSEWSACVSSTHCPTIKTPLYTWQKEVSDEWDEGRDAMQEIMKRKLESWRQTDMCIADGSCPELRRKAIPGYFECENGNAGGSQCLNVDQIAHLGFEELGYSPPIPGDTNPRGNDVWGWTDPLTGKEYVIAGVSGGTSFVDISNPTDPKALAFVLSATTNSNWRDMKVIGNYVYIVAEAADHGLQVFDLRRLRNLTPTTPIPRLLPDATNKNFGQAHNIVANEDTNYIYVVGATRTTGAGGAVYQTCRGGLQIFDVRNPLNPVQVGCFGDDGYVHDAQCVIYHGPDVAYQNREICFCYNENSLTIVDVNDKNNMFVIAKSSYINVAYTHQGWITDDHKIVLLDDEQDELRGHQYTKTYVWDIQDLKTPTLRSIFESPETSVDHNQYIIGDYVYQGNYESGLRILHINHQTYTLTLVGYLDVFPTRTTPAFNGVWSVFPYFKSGYVAVQSINDGFFLAKPDMNAIESLVRNKTIPAEQTRTRSILPSFIGATCPHNVETKSCSAPVLC